MAMKTNKRAFKLIIINLRAIVAGVYYLNTSLFNHAFLRCFLVREGLSGVASSVCPGDSPLHRNCVSLEHLLVGSRRLCLCSLVLRRF